MLSASPAPPALVPQVLERGTRQLISVPLTKGGRELGAVDLLIQHQATLPPAK